MTTYSPVGRSTASWDATSVARISSIVGSASSNPKSKVHDPKLLAAPDERPTAQKGDCLWLLDFSPDQVHRPPLRGPLIRGRLARRFQTSCTAWPADGQTGDGEKPSVRLLRDLAEIWSRNIVNMNQFPT